MDILLDEVALHKDVLFSSFQTTVSNKMKKDTWEHIAMKMDDAVFDLAQLFAVSLP